MKAPWTRRAEEQRAWEHSIMQRAQDAEASARQAHRDALEAQKEAVAAREEAAATRTEAEGVKKESAELVRVIASSPMFGQPTPAEVHPKEGQRSGIYKLDFPYQFHTPQPPRRRPGSYVTLDLLRQLGDTYDILRDCILHLQREVASVPFKIIPRDKDDESDEIKARVVEATQWFEISGGCGGRGRRRAHFEQELIDDLCLIGAAAVYYRPARGGKVFECYAIDAATIRPKIDPYGFAPDGKVYEQWIMGVMTKDFSAAEILYDGLYSVSYSPFFKSPTEYLIYVIQTALKADEWDRLWLTEGNTPADLLAVPDDWKPGDIQEFTEYFDALTAGNTRERVKTRFVPGGTSRLMNQSRADQQFSELQLWLLRRTCAIFGVHPAAIGFVGEQFAVTQENSLDATSAFGAGILLDWRKVLYDDMLQRLGYPELQFENIIKGENADKRAERLVKLVGAGIKKPNEARKEEGDEAAPGGDQLYMSSMYVPLTELEAQAGQQTEMQEKQLSADPAQQQAGPGAQPGGQPGGAPQQRGAAVHNPARDRARDAHAEREKNRPTQDPGLMDPAQALVESYEALMEEAGVPDVIILAVRADAELLAGGDPVAFAQAYKAGAEMAMAQVRELEAGAKSDEREDQKMALAAQKATAPKASAR